MNKTSLFAVAAIVFASLTGCTVTRPSEPPRSTNVVLNAVTVITQTNELPLNLQGLEVDNRSGAIHIVGTPVSPASWSWKLTAHAPTDALARQAAEAASCKAEWEGDRLRLVVTLPDPDESRSFQSDFDIRVPKSAAVRTRNRFGKTGIMFLDGDVEATGQNGAVEIQNVGGKVQAQTAFALLRVGTVGAASLKNQNGAIEAADVRGPLDAETRFAALDARDISGSVHLRNQNGRIEVARAGAADLQTSFATLTAKGINGSARLANQNGSVTASDITGAVNATTSFATLDIEGAGASFVCANQNGDIRVRATSATLTNLQAGTSFATLEVRLPADLKPAIQAQTRFGKVESDFPVLTQPPGEDPLTGVPVGTARIRLQNQNGNIRVVRE